MTTTDLKTALFDAESEALRTGDKYSWRDKGDLESAAASVLAFLSAPPPCRLCGCVSRSHVHTSAPTIDAAFIAKYPS